MQTFIRHVTKNWNHYQPSSFKVRCGTWSCWTFETFPFLNSTTFFDDNHHHRHHYRPPLPSTIDNPSNHCLSTTNQIQWLLLHKQLAPIRNSMSTTHSQVEYPANFCTHTYWSPTTTSLRRHHKPSLLATSSRSLRCSAANFQGCKANGLPGAPTTRSSSRTGAERACSRASTSSQMQWVLHSDSRVSLGVHDGENGGFWRSCSHF